MTTREQLIPHDPTATVAAGGIAPLKAKLVSDERTTPVTARSYAHPAIPGKVVVRLEPDAIAAGTDAEMAAFGFAAPEVSAPLGQVRFRTLGFPAWALVHEPKKAKVALDVTDDMRVAKRLVVAKPGHARDAFEKIAKTLQRSAPQFLPSFWEECGRVIADHASTAMAAQCFEKARAAERAFKLSPDGEATDAVFVEFALLGALAVKSLSAYAKELVKSAGGKEAYRRFRSIIIKRALGGMPPYSGMLKDLGALVAAAGLDEEAEQDALFAELVEAPGVAKAPAEFWSSARPSLVKIGAPVRARLRAIWPEPRGGSDDARTAFRTTWLEILRETGALGDLPDEGLGAWVSRLVSYAGGVPAVIASLRELAPRLVALRQPISVHADSRWQETPLLDLAELALELGVALVDPGEDATFDPDAMTCDPVRVAAHPTYGPCLVRTVAAVIGQEEQERAMRGKRGFAAARRAWLAGELGDLVKHGLYATGETLALLEEKTTAAMFAEFPELHAQLAATDLAAPLAHQLAGGSADELGWPVYEQAFAKLGGDIQVSGAFPIATLFNATKAIALDGSGAIAEHDLVYKPKEESPRDVLYVDRQFLVMLDVKRGQDTAYWSSEPKTRFDCKVYYRTWDGDMPIQWSPPGGGVTLGAKVFRAGDHELPVKSRFIVVGDRMFAMAAVQGKAAESLEEAAMGEFFMPWPKLDLAGCVYLPVALSDSPLGVRDGIWGMRTREIAGDRYESQRLGDDAPVTTHVQADALLDLPGLASPLPLCTAQADHARFPGGNGYGVDLWTSTHFVAKLNEHDWAARGWGPVHVPPLVCWHYLVPRDRIASLALRQVTGADARPIFEAAQRDLAAAPDASGRTMTQAEAAIRAALPVTDAVLVRGLAGLAEKAAELDVKLRELVESRNPANASDGALTARAGKLVKLARALVNGKPTSIADFDIDLRDWLKHGRGAAIASLGPTAQVEARALAVDVALGLPDTLFADDLAKVRIFELATPDDFEDPTPWETVLVVREGASVFAIVPHDDYVIEYATDGVFRAPPKPWLVGKTEDRALRPMGSAWLRGFPALAESPPAWSPEIAARLAAASGLTIPEATLLSIGLEGVTRWGKDYLGKKVRDRLGLKMGDADAARTTFAKVMRDDVHALMTTAAPDDPAALREPLAPGGYIDRLGAAWKAKYGKRVKLPAELVAAAKSALDFGRDLDELLPPFAGEFDAWFMKPDLRKLDALDRGEEGLDRGSADNLAVLIAWLFLARPVGDALRTGIPAVAAKLRAIVADPRTVWPVDALYCHGDDKELERARSVLASIGGAPVDLAKPNGLGEAGEGRDDGAILGILDEGTLTVGVRTAKLESAKKKIETIARAMANEGGPDPLAVLKTITYFGGDAFAALAERVTTTPVPAGGYEANPLASAGKLVAKVAKACGISSEAAALYLQTLALAEPKQRDVIEWNGWTAKQYAAAAAELVKKKLVIEGKRERAGRTIFVKGGYGKGRDKDLPMEEWKEPFYTQLRRHLPAEPVHLLYARAWKRVDDGDGPR